MCGAHVSTDSAVSLRGWNAQFTMGRWFEQRNVLNIERNMSQLILLHRPDDDKILKCCHSTLLVPVRIFTGSFKDKVSIAVT